MAKPKKEAFKLHGMQALYEFYCEQQRAFGEPIVSYLKYTETLKRFNNAVIERVLDGEVFYPGHKLGQINIVKHPRNFEFPTIDWGETDKLFEKEGVRQYVYYQDDWYCRWYWRKYTCSLPNKSVYSFQPSKGPTGATRRLSRKIKSDPFIHLKYLSRARIGESSKQ